MSKILAVNQFKKPQNVHEVRQFLGLASYFRKFIENFALVARPLTQLTKKNMSFKWAADQEHAFLALKEKLTSRPVLALYNPNSETEIHTDASKLGIGGILLQKQVDRTLKPIAYFSRVTSKEEQAYHSYELETLAVVESIKRFRIYVAGIKFKVVTDCSAVRATLTKRDLVPRIARWWLHIQEYDIDIEYRPGKRMKHVDALSRNAISASVLTLSQEDWFLTLQLQDDSIKSIISQVNSTNPNKDIEQNYVYENNRLYRKTLAGNRLVVPKFAKFSLLRKFHDDIGHCGLDKCEKIINGTIGFQA